MSHRALSPRQFDISQEMGLHPSLGGSQVPDVIEGRVATHVMAQAGIRQTKKIGERTLSTGEQYHIHVDAPHIVGIVGGYGNYGYRPHHEELWTSQRHLHVPTLRGYAEGGLAPDPSDWDQEDNPEYEPETYRHGGKRWLAEGHHRTVATRLGRRT